MIITGAEQVSSTILCKSDPSCVLVMSSIASLILNASISAERLDMDSKPNLSQALVANTPEALKIAYFIQLCSISDCAHDKNNFTQDFSNEFESEQVRK